MAPFPRFLPPQSKISDISGYATGGLVRCALEKKYIDILYYTKYCIVSLLEFLPHFPTAGYKS